MIEPKIKQIAQDLDLDYKYGALHWQNLRDGILDHDLPFAERKKYLSFLWNDVNDILNDYGGVEKTEFIGELYLMVRTKLGDESGQSKWDDVVSHMYAIGRDIRARVVDCDNFLPRRWQMVEVYNEFDANFDGIKIKFTIEKKAL